jgi:hypothetical protein
MYRVAFLLIITALLLRPCGAKAQSADDSTKAVPTDTTQVLRKDTVIHSAKRAALMSAIFPGSGQYYNKKYWKLPLVYGGFATMIAVLSFEQKYYSKYKKDYAYSVNHDSVPVLENGYPYTYSDLLTVRDYYRRNRDLTWIVTGVFYVLNILDAYVDGELFNFDISDDLSFHAEPALMNYSGTAMAAGLHLTLNLK